MGQKFEQIEEMPLRHLPNKCRLHVQRQRGEYIPKDRIQLYIASSFENSENGQMVWNRGFSIGLEAVPEMIGMLERVQTKFESEGRGGSVKEYTGTFADMA